MGRFCDPDEMIGAILWVISDASDFVTGIMVPLGGAFLHLVVYDI
jgi:NAD(P)-dependent dehydrogenase (short-subunit alcohol dehydrogenase family)